MPSRRDSQVARQAQHPVVILYEHALLAEGIANYLRAQMGVEATLAPAHDLQAVTSALALGPTVIIFELSEELQHVDLNALAPQAILIDVSTVVTRGTSPSPDAAGLDKILQAVRESSQSTPPSPAEPTPSAE